MPSENNLRKAAGLPFRNQYGGDVTASCRAMTLPPLPEEYALTAPALAPLSTSQDIIFPLTTSTVSAVGPPVHTTEAEVREPFAIVVEAFGFIDKARAIRGSPLVIYYGTGSVTLEHRVFFFSKTKMMIAYLFLKRFLPLSREKLSDAILQVLGIPWDGTKITLSETKSMKLYPDLRNYPGLERYGCEGLHFAPPALVTVVGAKATQLDYALN